MKQIILATLLAGVAATGAMAQPVPGPIVHIIHGVHSGNLTGPTIQHKLQDFTKKHTRGLIGSGDHDYVNHGMLGEDGHGIWHPTQPGEVVIFDEG